MKRRFTHPWLRQISLLTLGSWPLWTSQACLSTVDKATPVQLSVQDSTGRPLAGYRLALTGVKRGGLNLGLGGKPSQVIDEVVVTTDLTGSVKRDLHWSDEIDYYRIANTEQAPVYARYSMVLPCSSPLSAACELSKPGSVITSQPTIDLVIQVKAH